MYLWESISWRFLTRFSSPNNVGSNSTINLVCSIEKVNRPVGRSSVQLYIVRALWQYISLSFTSSEAYRLCTLSPDTAVRPCSWRTWLSFSSNASRLLFFSFASSQSNWRRGKNIRACVYEHFGLVNYIWTDINTYIDKKNKTKNYTFNEILA